MNLYEVTVEYHMVVWAKSEPDACGFACNDAEEYCGYIDAVKLPSQDDRPYPGEWQGLVPLGEAPERFKGLAVEDILIMKNGPLSEIDTAAPPFPFSGGAV